jgi:uncharacterized protein
MPWWLQVLNWLGSTVYVAVIGLGAVAAFLSLPGTPLVLAAGLIFSAAHHWQHPPVALILGLIPLAFVIELLDNFLSMAGVRRFGGSGGTMTWVLVGGLGGAFVLSTLAPAFGLAGLLGGPVGVLIGALVPPLAGGILGGYLGAYLFERHQGRPAPEARRAGWGALMGRLLGGLVRGALTLVMAIVLLIYSFSQ